MSHWKTNKTKCFFAVHDNVLTIIEQQKPKKFKKTLSNIVIQQHVDRQASPQTVNFAPGATTQSTLPTTTQTTTTQVKIPGVYVGGFKAPGYTLQWTDTPTYTDFIFINLANSASGFNNNSYMAVGFSSDNQMVLFHFFQIEIMNKHKI